MRNQVEARWEQAACLVLGLAVIDMAHGCRFLSHGGFLIPRKCSLDKQCSRKHRPNACVELRVKFRTPVKSNTGSSF